MLRTGQRSWTAHSSVLILSNGRGATNTPFGLAQILFRGEAMFAKVFAQIFTSSIAQNYLTRLVFEDFLVLADVEGVVDMTPESISRITNVPLDIVLAGISELEKPDTRSRTGDEEGCRIIRLDEHRDWGWLIVNYRKYRDMHSQEDRRAYFREAKRRSRSKTVKDQPLDFQDSPSSSVSTSFFGKEESEKENQIPDWVPGDAWDGFVEMRKKIKKPLTPRAQQLTIRNLEKLRAEGHDPGEVLDQSTLHSWQGVFPIKANGNGNAPRDLSAYKELVFRCYRFMNTCDPPWGDEDERELDRLTSAMPKMTTDQFYEMLNNYAKSENKVRGDRPAKFIPNLPSYINGSLTKYRREDQA